MSTKTPFFYERFKKCAALKNYLLRTKIKVPSRKKKWLYIIEIYSLFFGTTLIASLRSNLKPATFWKINIFSNERKDYFSSSLYLTPDFSFSSTVQTSASICVVNCKIQVFKGNLVDSWLPPKESETSIFPRLKCSERDLHHKWNPMYFAFSVPF